MLRVYLMNLTKTRIIKICSIIEEILQIIVSMQRTECVVRDRLRWNLTRQGVEYRYEFRISIPILRMRYKTNQPMA